MDQFEYLRDAYDDTTMSQAPPTATRPRALSASERTAEEAVGGIDESPNGVCRRHSRSEETRGRGGEASWRGEWRAGAAAARYQQQQTETARHFPSPVPSPESPRLLRPPLLRCCYRLLPLPFQNSDSELSCPTETKESTLNTQPRQVIRLRWTKCGRPSRDRLPLNRGWIRG